MEYRTLGRSGLRISRLSLGAMTFGAGSGIWGEIAGLDRAQAARLVAVAAEQGINLIDTADAYSQGKSEEVVGQVLSDLGLDETRMLVATKVRLRTGPGPNEVGLGRKPTVEGSFTDSCAVCHRLHGRIGSQLAVDVARGTQNALNVAGGICPQRPVGNQGH